jgi:predicted Zn-dependent protease
MALRKFPLILLILLLVSGCKKSPKIYFVPIGEVPLEEVNDLVSHYRDKFGIQAEVLPAIKPGLRDFDHDRNQLIAENLIQTMLSAYSDYRTNNGDVLIGITGEDIYPQSQGWQFCFGWRVGEQRAAIASTARMNLRYLGEPSDGTSLRERLRKVVTKDVGLLYYQKAASENPRSVLYSGIMGIQELDLVSEDF